MTSRMTLVKASLISKVSTMAMEKRNKMRKNKAILVNSPQTI